MVDGLHDLVLLHEFQGVVLHPFLAEALDGHLVAHTLVICPHTLLHHTKLTLPKLLVNRDGIGLDDMLRRNLDGAPIALS